MAREHRRPGRAGALGGRAGAALGRRRGRRPRARRAPRRARRPRRAAALARRLRARLARQRRRRGRAISSPRCSPAIGAAPGRPRPRPASTAGCGSRATGSAPRCRSSPRSAPAISLATPSAAGRISPCSRSDVPDGELVERLRGRDRRAPPGARPRPHRLAAFADAARARRRLRAPARRPRVGEAAITSVADLRARLRILLARPQPAPSGLDRQPRRRAARSERGLRRRPGARMSDRATGTLGGAYGGSGPD